jgi:hypothetical protein
MRLGWVEMLLGTAVKILPRISLQETRINQQQKKDIKEIKQLFITQHHHIKKHAG